MHCTMRACEAQTDKNVVKLDAYHEHEEPPPTVKNCDGRRTGVDGVYERAILFCAQVWSMRRRFDICASIEAHRAFLCPDATACSRASTRSPIVALSHTSQTDTTRELKSSPHMLRTKHGAAGLRLAWLPAAPCQQRHCALDPHRTTASRGHAPTWLGEGRVDREIKQRRVSGDTALAWLRRHDTGLRSG